ncbi:EIF-2-alpha kinase GCN2 isoform X2 [Oopsacas minuta]|uniref:EIF-2-alpha kinase GCN2 isoform X2 n=1 Tax=Oopsacas minuta TaxID=111878 RepID=A0AAV7KF60_9METZ|nr:EIF-2-alpha kinase GCN2 isoform X2 [Oopsacas minuta]
MKDTEPPITLRWEYRKELSIASAKLSAGEHRGSLAIPDSDAVVYGVQPYNVSQFSISNIIGETRNVWHTSRLELEYGRQISVGKGGHGVVVRVINKLDNSEYAIKKIKLRGNPHEFVREVQLLAKLSHENVIRDYCVWLDYEIDKREDAGNGTSEIESTACETGSASSVSKRSNLGHEDDSNDTGLTRCLSRNSLINTMTILSRIMVKNDIILDKKMKTLLEQICYVSSIAT